MKNTNIKKIKKIAVFRALHLGDLLCTVPAFRSLRGHFPYAKITLIGLPSSNSFVERYSSYIDGHIPFPGFPGLPEQKFYLDRFVPFVERVKKENFDLILQMQGEGNVANALVMLFGGKSYAGFCSKNKERPGPLFSYYPDYGPEVHRMLSLLKNLEIPIQGDWMEIPVSEKERREFKDLLSFYYLEEKKYVCIHPGSRDLKKRISPVVFIGVAKDLYKKGYQIVITGSEDEKILCEEIKNSIGYPVVDLCGRTKDLGVLAGVIKGSSITLSNDTSVSHIAQAVKAPSVILFKSSDPSRWSPMDRDLHKVIEKGKSEDPFFVAKIINDQLEKFTAYEGIKTL